jgi:hypothetical protein
MKTRSRFCVMTLLAVTIFASSASAQDRTASANASPNASHVAHPPDDGTTWKNVEIRAGTVASKALYVPAKLVYRILGVITGGTRYALTGGNQQGGKASIPLTHPLDSGAGPVDSFGRASVTDPDVGANASMGSHTMPHRTASGERLDPNRLTAASSTLPMVSIVRMTNVQEVTNVQEGRPVDVKVNDRGPRARSRSVDLSPAAAQRIGLADRGAARVKITPARKPLSESDLLKLLAGGVYSGRVATLVRKRGINFKPTKHYLELLRRAGGDNELERAIAAAPVDASQIAASP